MSTIHVGSIEDNVIQEAINDAAQGDELLLPEGDVAWALGIKSLDKSLLLRGAGAGLTNVRDNIPRTLNGGRGFIARIRKDQWFRVTGMSFHAYRQESNYNGFFQFYGGTQRFRMDHVGLRGFDSANATNLLVFDNVCGVVDTIDAECKFCVIFNVNHTAWEGVGSYGDNSWVQPSEWGTARALYIEHGTYKNVGTVEQAMVDAGRGGGRVCVRYNKIHAYSIGNHGAESGGRARGGRQIEAYGNELTSTKTSPRLFFIRSGPALLWGNRKSGPFNGWGNVWSPRATDALGSWGGADGRGKWDDNGPVEYSGIAGVGSGLDVLVDETANFPVNGLVGKTLRQANGRFSCITSNTVTQIKTAASYYNQNHTFVAGTAYEVVKVQSVIDSPGHGRCPVMLSGSPPLPAQPVLNELEAVRCWDNVSTQAPVFAKFGGMPGGWFKSGVHWIWSDDSSAKPEGYAPLADPHPFTATEIPGGEAPPPPDTEAPVVTILTPAMGAVLEGVASVVVRATDNREIAGVHVEVAGVVLEGSPLPPDGVQFDTKLLTNGAYTIVAVARDTAGLEGTAQIDVRIDNDSTPPQVRIVQPEPGERLHNKLVIEAETTDNRAVVGAAVELDGVPVEHVLLGSVVTAEVTLRDLDDGTHAVEVSASDAAGHVGRAHFFFEVVRVNLAVIGREASR